MIKTIEDTKGEAYNPKPIIFKTFGAMIMHLVRFNFIPPVIFKSINF